MEVQKHEAHISAQETSKKHGAWIPEKNEYIQRPQGFAAQAQKRQNGTFGVNRPGYEIY